MAQTPYEWYNQQMVNKEEQKKLLTEIMETDAQDGLYKQQTIIDWFIENVPERIHNAIKNLCEDEIAEARRVEKRRIIDAIMYALDEDGHTGDWKIKFANDYINKHYENSTSI